MNRPVIIKIVALGTVLLALLFGLSLVQDVVNDRQSHRYQAASSVANSIAGNQTVVGPFVHMSCVESWDEKVKDPDGTTTVQEKRREFMMTAVPESLDIKSSTGIENRARGLHQVNVFNNKAIIKAEWASLNKLKPTQEVKNSRMNCGTPILMLGVSDVRGIRNVKLNVDGTPHKLKAGTFHPVYSKGVHATLPDNLRNSNSSSNSNSAIIAIVEMELVGTDSLSIAPVGDTTQVRMQSNWPHPSFAGRFSPAERNITEQGFDATWRLTSMATSAGQDVVQSRPVCQQNDQAAAQDSSKACVETLQVSFIDPINPYSLSDRATKYGLLFIVLTFAAVGLFEVMKHLRVHPVQYFLVGSAISIFFLLLVSLSEHFSFNLAYAAAASACVLLLTYYASYMLHGFLRGLPFGLGVASLYGLLFVLLQLEQTALVVGAVALFAALALVMFLTRKIDWYQLTTGAGSQPE